MMVVTRRGTMADLRNMIDEMVHRALKIHLFASLYSIDW